MSRSVARIGQIKQGVRLEVITICWLAVEVVLSFVAGILARSLLLTAFGIDSVIELISGTILLWRLTVEADGGEPSRITRAEERATWLVAVALALLCLYVLTTAIIGLITHAKPEGSPLGIAISAAAIPVMVWLAIGKRRVAGRIASDALAGDATSSLTCAYMAATVLVGLLLNALLGWWWAEDIAALAFLVWLIGETREAFEEAREGAGEE